MCTSRIDQGMAFWKITMHQSTRPLVVCGRFASPRAISPPSPRLSLSVHPCFCYCNWENAANKTRRDESGKRDGRYIGLFPPGSASHQCNMIGFTWASRQPPQCDRIQPTLPLTIEKRLHCTTLHYTELLPCFVPMHACRVGEREKKRQRLTTVLRLVIGDGRDTHSTGSIGIVQRFTLYSTGTIGSSWTSSQT